jgi:hypothetical protein
MSGGGRVVVVLGFLLHGLVLFPFLASGLVVPGPVVPGLLAVWAGLLALGIRRRSRPGWVLATPFLAIGFLLAVVTFGDLFLGWTA